MGVIGQHCFTEKGQAVDRSFVANADEILSKLTINSGFPDDNRFVKVSASVDNNHYRETVRVDIYQAISWLLAERDVLYHKYDPAHTHLSQLTAPSDKLGVRYILKKIKEQNPDKDYKDLSQVDRDFIDAVKALEEFKALWIDTNKLNELNHQIRSHAGNLTRRAGASERQVG